MPPAFFIGDTPTGFIGYHHWNHFFRTPVTNQNPRTENCKPVYVAFPF